VLIAVYIGFHLSLHLAESPIPADLHSEPFQCVAILEDIPETEEDWHPGTNGQVLDVVHPSLYCIVYGRTLAVPGAIRQVAHPIDYTPWEKSSPSHLHTAPSHQEAANEVSSEFVSNSFSWLPTDFSISPDGKGARSLGYINNIHPQSNINVLRG